MNAESRKAYRHGFVLGESDLRRIVDVVSEQIKKLSVDGIARSRFLIKFKNGVTAETGILDDVLAMDNGGSGQITMVRYETL